MYFRFLASKALHRTLYHAEHLSVSQFQLWMLIILTRTQLVLLSSSNPLGAVLCLPRLCLPQGLVPTAKPPAKAAPKAAKPRANPQPRVQPNLLPRWQPRLQLESPFLAPVEHVQLFRVKSSRQKKWQTEPVSERS